MTNVVLELGAYKTEVAALVGSRRTKGMRVTVCGHDIEARGEIKYLGVWVGREFRFGPHIRKTVAKAEVKIKSLSRIMPNGGGPREATRRVLCGVAVAQVLYAAPIWYSALRYATYREAVDRLQRRMAIRITSAYRTVSGPAAMVTAKVLPLHLLAAERVWLAECAGRTITEAREIFLTTWQRLWVNETRGHWTRRLIPDIKPWYERKHGEVDYWTSQLITGHGGFGAYLHKFKKKESPDCNYYGQIDTVEHTFFICPRWEIIRNATWLAVGGRTTPEGLVQAMLSAEDNWTAVTVMARRILSCKEKEGPSRTQPPVRG